MLNDFKFRANVLITSALYFLRRIYMSLYENQIHILKEEFIMILTILMALLILVFAFIAVALVGGFAVFISYLDVIIIIAVLLWLIKKFIRRIKK